MGPRSSSSIRIAVAAKTGERQIKAKPDTIMSNIRFRTEAPPTTASHVNLLTRILILLRSLPEVVDASAQ